MSNKNKRKKNKVKLTEMEQMLEVLPISGLGLTRYTFDSWMRCYPDANDDEYKRRQEPDNLLQYLVDYMQSSFPNKRPNANLPIKLRLIDEDYFKWLGDRNNDEKMRSNYSGTDHEADKIHAANLGVTRWLFGIPVVGVIKDKKINAELSQEAVKEIRGFLEKTFSYPGYSFYVVPYLIESANLFLNRGHIMQMAGIWFNQGVNVRYGKFDEIQSESPMTFTVSMIPVVVQLKHDLDNIKVGDILYYLGEKFPEYDEFSSHSQIRHIFDIVGYDESVVAHDKQFKASKAGKEILKWTQGRILGAEDETFGETLSLMMVCVDDFPDFYDAMVDLIVSEFSDEVRTTK